ncbi:MULTISPECIES: hypothetical protein [Mycobacteriaceae]|uniref:hypothetical protein n=1 Tax=Mycobacteriaceae TaxID=1762 RepID=UPI0007496496|nr:MULTISPECIES: hypothetical protein [Mycobacteriaceae]KUH94693.1 hypothetical protein AU189_17880 [Mycolicibacterium acapulense]KUH67864.1 hypothetical protein AU072_24900 [Mycolicibacterium novocastrense]KUH68337.1 hypothetical protein AU184_22830 [Mycolicibacterium novocastrense]KUH73416.1 hypothetical protein AU183_23720 [Mycolicibacterium novocastrense]KUI44937.1 hypothetical protein AU197_11735 [Mycobacterium sp. IS-1590]
MADDFSDQVQSIVGPLLSELGFRLDGVDLNVDEGGRLGAVVYYRSADCKIQVYQSAREGSTNCMIAPLDAPNVFGPHDRSLSWQYLTKFVPLPDTPLEELVESVSFKPKTTAEQLRWVRDIIGEHFEAARAGILGR